VSGEINRICASICDRQLSVPSGGREREGRKLKRGKGDTFSCQYKPKSDIQLVGVPIRS